MMSPRLPIPRATHAPRTRGRRLPAFAATVACAACLVVATAATPVASAAASPDPAVAAARQASQAWNPFFASERAVPVTDSRHVVVLFDDPSLGEWVAAGARPLTAVQRKAWVKRALALQAKRLDALALAGVQFRVDHRYVRVANGASLLVHGDGAQLLRSMPAVAQVVPVHPLWPTAIAPGAATKAADDGAAGAAAAAGAPAADPHAVRVAVLDTGIDANHPAVAGHVAQALDATTQGGAATEPAIAPNEHGTAVAGAVLRGAGAGVDVQLVPVQVLSRRPARDGVEAVLGESDDLLAGLELAVDPNSDGDTSDALDVAVVASTTPFAGFTGSPEDLAVHGADALGTVVVAAAGNDGASGDDVGTIGSVAASEAALSVGAADLRDRTPGATVRVRGDGIDQTFAHAAVLTAGSARLPGGKLTTVVVEGAGDEVTDYLDSELRSRVSGAVALVATRVGVAVADQVRAAADAGAVAVLVGSDHAGPAAGTIDVRGADIPAIALERSDARALRDALAAGTRLSLTLDPTFEHNDAYGTVAGFSSAGPRFDGHGRPDALASGVGMLVAGPGATWHVASGTSIAAGWAAGQVAAVRSARPAWSPALVRSALLGTAIPLGEVGDRPTVATQGAGVLDAARAAGTGWVAGSGRIDFGAVAPGAEVRRGLDLTALAATGGTLRGARILLDDGGHSGAVTPTLDDDQLVLAVGAHARPGHVGGWLVLPDNGIRIPWSATVRDPAAAATPVTADVSTHALQPVAGPGAWASTLTLAIGGASHGDDALGLAAVQRLEVRLVDASGKDHGAIGGLDQALPGVYSFGLAGVDPTGKRLARGTWTLQVRYVPASDPTGEWRDGPSTTVTVTPARPAK
ncbi:MAG: putative peptidase family protein [Thermoleophilia bacterium]|nr:putative peptidase family protein [Thermoleophilia bacterium]